MVINQVFQAIAGTQILIRWQRRVAAVAVKQEDEK